jgi:RHS repeat-associated protein
MPVILTDETNSYIYGPGNLPIEQINASEEPTYLHHDQQGSTRLLTNTKGESAGAYSYTPYGGIEEHKGTATTPLGYDAQYTTENTGLIYMRARTYDPKTCQFLTIDPALIETGEPYAYAGDNPLNAADADGEQVVTRYQDMPGPPVVRGTPGLQPPVVSAQPGPQPPASGLPRAPVVQDSPGWMTPDEYQRWLWRQIIYNSTPPFSMPSYNSPPSFQIPVDPSTPPSNLADILGHFRVYTVPSYNYNNGQTGPYYMLGWWWGNRPDTPYYRSIYDPLPSYSPNPSNPYDIPFYTSPYYMPRVP